MHSPAGRPSLEPPLERVGQTKADSFAAPAAAAPAAVPRPLADSDVPAFLRKYGLQASTAMDWRGAPPELSLEVSGHTVAGGHTVYQVECALGRAGSRPPAGAGPSASSSAAACRPLSWTVARRLADLRAGLHDPVRKALGSSYGTYFCGVHFAHRLRPSGTTSRLDAWCRRLAYCVNSKLVPPAVAAETLRVLGAPAPARGTAAAGAAAAGACAAGAGAQGGPPTAAASSCPGAKVDVAVPFVVTRSATADSVGDAGSTCTGGGNSARGIDGEETPESPTHAGFAIEGASDEVASWRGSDCEDDDDDDLTEEVLRSGLPGL